MRNAIMRRACLAVCAALAPVAVEAQAARNVAVRDLSEMSLEDLANVQISSVSKRPERLADAAAAVYVITGEDIRRSGYLTLPDVLRLAPNLQVARVDASQYAISARGFNSTTANKLLVLVDGRSVYTPLFSGVFWDAPDVMLDDVERIEVVSGPGGTLWGANAVNGVINVITRSAKDTDGVATSLAIGNVEHRANARWGGKLGDDAAVRIYAKGFRRDDTLRASGASARDDWKKAQAGFRVDGGPAANAYTVQGDIYDGSLDQGTATNPARKQISGANLLGRWVRTLRDNSTLQVQGYWDRSERNHPGSFAETLDTFDLDVHHNFAWRGNHEVLWGFGWRRSRDEVTNSPNLAFLPARKWLSLGNVFAQDTIALGDAWKLTLGAKLERNNYTGWEFQPNARLAWEATPRALLWSALSRAVRTPSRLDRDLFSPSTPPFTNVAGGPTFASEKLTALEIGWRAQPTPRLSYTVAGYWHKYDDLRSFESIAPSGTGLPAVVGNMMEGRTHGVEAWGTWQASENWRLSAGGNWLHKHLHFKPGSRDISGIRAAGNDPSHQWYLRSAANFGPDMEFDVNLRHVAGLPNPAIPSYTALDLRWGWHMRRDVELSMAVHNVGDRGHPEFGAAATRGEVPRSVQLKLAWRLP